MGKSAVLLVTCAQLPVLLTVSPFRKEKWRTVDGIPNFSESIFHAALCAGFVKRPVPPMRFN